MGPLPVPMGAAQAPTGRLMTQAPVRESFRDVKFRIQNRVIQDLDPKLDLSNQVEAFIQRKKMQLSMLDGRLRLISPQRRITNEFQRLDETQRRLYRAERQRTSLARSGLLGLEKRLLALDPLAVLQRGYAVVQREKDGVTVGRKELVETGDSLRIRVSDGEFSAQVTGE